MEWCVEWILQQLLDLSGTLMTFEEVRRGRFPIIKEAKNEKYDLIE